MNDRVLDIVMEWEERSREGQAVSVEQLCGEDRELVIEVRSHIKALLGTVWLERHRTRTSDAAEPSQDPGAVLADLPNRYGRYEVRDLIGIGGFGYVLRGHDPELHRDVAIKVPHGDRVRLPAQSEQFFREARHLASLRHPGIVSVYDVGREGGRCYIVTELIDGVSLAEQLALDPPDWRQSCRIIMRVAEILAYAHGEGFVHRDIKPGNILIEHDGGVHLADFGIATRDEGDSSRPIVYSGTRAYMAPEQKAGKTVDLRADLYSLGVALYQLIVGDLPKAKRAEGVREALRAAAPDIAPPVVDIIARLLQVDADDRYQSAAEVAEVLRLALGAGADRETSDKTVKRASTGAIVARWSFAALAVALITLTVTESTGLTRLLTRTQATDPLVEVPRVIEPVAPPAPLPLVPVTGTPPPPMPLLAGPDRRVYQEFWAKYYRVPVSFTNSVGIRFVLIAPGDFHMGLPRYEQMKFLTRGRNELDISDDDARESKDELPTHMVTLTRPFFISVDELTQEQYESVMGANPSYFAASGPGKEQLTNLDTRRQPVENVTWHEAVEYCTRLTDREFAAPSVAGEVAAPAEEAYRLPTEAEWEYAARAGVTDAWWKDANKTTREFFAGTGVRHPQQVGQLRENSFGLRDALGNVAEWVNDRYGPFTKEDARDPTGPTEGDLRVVRGGAYDDAFHALRESARRGVDPHERSPRVGFRVAISVDAARPLCGERGEQRGDPDRDLAAWALSNKLGPVGIQTDRMERLDLRGQDQIPDANLFVNSLQLHLMTDGSVRALLPHARGCRQLFTIWIDCRAGVTGESLPVIAEIRTIVNLRIAGLDKTSAEQAEAIASMRNLTSLSLDDSRIDFAFVRAIARIPQLRDLSLIRCATNDRAVEQLAAAPRLQSLTLNSDQITNEAMRSLSRFPQLRAVELRAAQVDDNVWASLAAAEELTSIVIDCPSLKGVGVDALAALTTLNELNVSSDDFEVRHLAPLAAMATLRKLGVHAPQIGDADLSVFEAFNNLNKLDLTRTLVTVSGANELKAKLPQCAIVITENGQERIIK